MKLEIDKSMFNSNMFKIFEENVKKDYEKACKTWAHRPNKIIHTPKNAFEWINEKIKIFNREHEDDLKVMEKSNKRSFESLYFTILKQGIENFLLADKYDGKNDGWWIWTKLGNKYFINEKFMKEYSLGVEFPELIHPRTGEYCISRNYYFYIKKKTDEYDRKHTIKCDTSYEAKFKK